MRRPATRGGRGDGVPDRQCAGLGRRNRRPLSGRHPRREQSHQDGGARTRSRSGANAAEIIDGQGMMLMPGLVEGHCHLSFVGRRANRISAKFRPRSICCGPAAMRRSSSTTASPPAIPPPPPNCGSTSSSSGNRGRPPRRPALPRRRTRNHRDRRSWRRAQQHIHAESFGMIADGRRRNPPRRAALLPRRRRQCEVQCLRRRIRLTMRAPK